MGYSCNSFGGNPIRSYVSLAVGMAAFVVVDALFEAEAGMFPVCTSGRIDRYAFPGEERKCGLTNSVCTE